MLKLWDLAMIEWVLPASTLQLLAYWR